MAKQHSLLCGAVLVTLVFAPLPARAWFDDTHSAVMRVSGTAFSPCLAVVADAMVFKIPNEMANHYTNEAPGKLVSAEDVLGQATRYDQPDPEGHVLGAVLAAWRQVGAMVQQKRRPAYAYGFLAHYIGDMSQPLHQSVNDAFNKAHHAAFDGLVNERADLEEQIRQRMQPIVIKGEADLIANIVRIANDTRALDARVRQGETFSAEAAFKQLAASASLLRAVNAQLFP